MLDKENILLSRKEKLTILKNIYLNSNSGNSRKQNNFGTTANKFNNKPNTNNNNNNNYNNYGSGQGVVESIHYNNNFNNKGGNASSNGFGITNRSISLNQAENSSNDQNLLDSYKYHNQNQNNKLLISYQNNNKNIKLDNYFSQDEKTKNKLITSFKSAKPGNRSNGNKLTAVGLSNRKLFSGNSSVKKEYPPINGSYGSNVNYDNGLGNGKGYNSGNGNGKTESLKNLLSNTMKANQRLKPHSKINSKNQAINSKMGSTSNVQNGKEMDSFVIDYSAKEDQGVRNHMEDCTKVVTNFQGQKNKVFFGVFDGHGGPEVANLAKDKLPANFAKMLSDPKLTVENAIINSFKVTDEIFKKYEKTGTTVCISYATNEKGKKVVYVANIGDSAAYLVNGSRAERMTYNHKVSDEKENARIKSSGGIIFSGRVFGTLELTRSFGDFGLKKYGVCPIPFINKLIVENDNKYIVMGSDGIWDVIDEELLHSLSLEAYNSEEYCDLIMKKAVELKTMDNISCITIKLN